MANAELFSIKEKIMKLDEVFEIITEKNRKLKNAEESSKKLLADFKEECLKNERLSLEFSSYKKTTNDYMDKYIKLKDRYDKLETKNNTIMTEHLSMQKSSVENSVRKQLVLKKQEEFCEELKKKNFTLTATVEALQQNEKNLKNQLEEMGKLQWKNEELENKLSRVEILLSNPGENTFAGFSTNNLNTEFNSYLDYMVHTDMLEDKEIFWLTNQMKTLPTIIKPIQNPKECKQKVNQGVQTAPTTRIMDTQTETTRESSKYIETKRESRETQTQPYKTGNKQTSNRFVQTDNLILCKCGKIQSDNLTSARKTENSSVSCDISIPIELKSGLNTVFECPIEIHNKMENNNFLTGNKSPEHKNSNKHRSVINKNVKINQTTNITSRINDQEVKTLVSTITQTDPSLNNKIQSANTQKTQTEAISISNAITQTNSSLVPTSNQHIQTENYNPIMRRRKISLQEAVATLKRANINITINAGRVISYKLNRKRNIENKFEDVITKLCKLIHHSNNSATKKKHQQRRNKLYLSRLKHSTSSLSYDTDSSLDSSHKPPPSECELNSIDSGYIRSDCETSIATTKTKSDYSTEYNRKHDFASDESSLLDEMKPVPELMSQRGNLESEDEDYINYILKEMTRETPILENCDSPEHRGVKRCDFKEDLGPTRKKPKDVLKEDFGEEIPLDVALDICSNVESVNSESIDYVSEYKVPLVHKTNLEISKLQSLDERDINNERSYKSDERAGSESQKVHLECVPKAEQPLSPMSDCSLRDNSVETVFVPLNKEKKVLKRSTNVDRLKKLRKNLVKSNRLPIMPSDKVSESEVVVAKKRIALLKSNIGKKNEQESLHLGRIIDDKTIVNKLKSIKNWEKEKSLNEKSGSEFETTVFKTEKSGIKSDCEGNIIQDVGIASRVKVASSIKTNDGLNFVGVVKNLGKKSKNQKVAERRLLTLSDEITGQKIDEKLQKRFKRPTRLSMKLECKEVDKALINGRKQMEEEKLKLVTESVEVNDSGKELRLDKSECEGKAVTDNLVKSNMLEMEKNLELVEIVEGKPLEDLVLSNLDSKILTKTDKVEEAAMFESVEQAYSDQTKEKFSIERKIVKDFEDYQEKSLTENVPAILLDVESLSKVAMQNHKESLIQSSFGEEPMEEDLEETFATDQSLPEISEIIGDDIQTSAKLYVIENESFDQLEAVSLSDEDSPKEAENISNENLENSNLSEDDEISLKICLNDDAKNEINFENSLMNEQNSESQNNLTIAKPMVDLKTEINKPMCKVGEAQEQFRQNPVEALQSNAVIHVKMGENMVEKTPVNNNICVRRSPRNHKNLADSLSSEISGGQEENKSLDLHQGANAKKEHNLDVCEMPVKKKKEHLNWDYVLKIFRNLIHFRGEKTKVDQSIIHLQKLDRETLLGYILQIIRTDNTEPERTQMPFEPHLTITQKVMLGLLLKLENERIFVETTNEFLTTCERWLLFNESDPDCVQKVTKMYAAVCKMKKDKTRLRRMLCDALYFMGDLALPFVYHILVSWIQVLPVEAKGSDLSDKPLIQVLVQVVHISNCKNPDYFMSVLKNLLIVYYKYPTERYDENALMKQFLEKYVCSLDERFETAILILCKHYKSEWCCKQFELMRQLMLVAKTRDICSALVKLIKKILQQFKNDKITLNKAQKLLNNVYNDFPNYNLSEITPKTR